MVCYPDFFRQPTPARARSVYAISACLSSRLVKRRKAKSTERPQGTECYCRGIAEWKTERLRDRSARITAARGYRHRTRLRATRFFRCGVVGETDFGQTKQFVARKQYRPADLNRQMQTSFEFPWPATPMRPNRINILGRQDFARSQAEMRYKMTGITHAHCAGVGDFYIDDLIA